jgi:hypothetical protein
MQKIHGEVLINTDTTGKVQIKIVRKIPEQQGSTWCTCKICTGTGTRACHACKGVGIVHFDSDRFSEGGKISCSSCGGNGSVNCGTCAGYGGVYKD